MIRKTLINQVYTVRNDPTHSIVFTHCQIVINAAPIVIEKCIGEVTAFKSQPIKNEHGE